MLYVDKLMNFGMIQGKIITNCHLWSDKSTEELIEFGKKIGMKKEWIHTGTINHDHFDLTLAKRILALKSGAKEYKL